MPQRPPIPIVPLDEDALAAARARQAQLVKPPGSLGRLEELAVWLAGCTGEERPEVRARVVIAAADRDAPVSAYPAEVTRQMLATFVAGRSAVTALAQETGAEVVVVDAGVAGRPVDGVARVEGLRPARDLAREPALGVGEVAAAVDAGGRSPPGRARTA
jgi:nicotinate-nucleotide--dimethylbenzimidazole phosphoribosyltransferase